MATLNPESLFKYVTEQAAKSVEAGNGSQYPTFREIKSHFKTTYAEIEIACEEWDQSRGYMQPAVGFRSGSSVGKYKCVGDYQVEAYI